jgi:hypothetical protein
MSRSLLRFAWPALCGVLTLSLIGSNIYWRKQARPTAAKAKKSAPEPAAFDKRGAAYFRELATAQGYQSLQSLTGADAARLAAYDRLDLNKRWAQERNGEPSTLASREQAFPESLKIPLAQTMTFHLPHRCHHYRYELTNKTDHSVRAPILFHNDRWDTATDLVAKAGFMEIPDEVERAVAIWRFVCPRRVFGEPPTEGLEEHDVIKFLSLYGYGFCDDSARSLATLAELSDLKSRVWELDGHVVAEVMAGGRWRMLDADQQAYFHRPGAPLDILGVEELSADRSAFDHLVSFRNATDYPPKYIDCFLSKENNKIVMGGNAEHKIEPYLRGGEQMTFTNYNWGRYFLGKYPTPPPRFYNGTFTYAFHARDLAKGGKGITNEPMDGGFRLVNHTEAIAQIELPFSYPFPVVGGLIEGAATVAKSTARLRLEDRDHERSLSMDLHESIHIDLDHFVAVLTADPTHRFSIVFELGPLAVLELRDFKVSSDFQFAGMVLLPLDEGDNEFHAHFPEKSRPEDFEFKVSWR